MTDHSNNPQALMAELSRFALFSALDAEHLRVVAADCRALNVARGQLICQQGDPAEGFHAVLEGQVKLVLPSPDGHEKVLEIIDAGHTFGEAVMFLGKAYPVNAEAIVGSRLLHIRAAGVFKALAERPAFARQMLAGMSLRLHKLVTDVESYCLLDARQRVTGYLLGLVDPRDQTQASGSVRLPVNKALLANRLNLTPETFSRILHDLGREGLVQVQGRVIEIPDVEALAFNARL